MTGSLWSRWCQMGGRIARATGIAVQCILPGQELKPREPRRDSWDLAFECANRSDYASRRLA